MGMKFSDDEDEQLDSILQMLGGEVDDFAASKLPADEKKLDGGGSTITITVKGPASVEGPSDKGAEDEENAGGSDKESMLKEEDDEPHDPIAHILGMCGGGCPGE